MRSCHHIQRAPRLRPPVYFVGSAPSPGTFCSSHPFFIPSRIGGDDEKHWSYSVGRRCHDVGDVFVCPEQRSVGQCEGTARSSSALQRLRHRAGWQGLDGLDWRSARPELSNDWSSHRPARCRSGEGSACDGNGQRSARATEAVFSPSNAGIASRLSRPCRGMCRPDRSGLDRDNGAGARRPSPLEDRYPTAITIEAYRPERQRHDTHRSCCPQRNAALPARRIRQFVARACASSDPQERHIHTA